MKSSSIEGVDTSQYFGFLPYTCMSQMQTKDYNKRIDSTQKILDYLPTIPIEDVEIPGFLRFLEEFVVDENMKVAQNCSLIIEEIISSLKDQALKYIHLFVKIANIQLSDKRRFVCQLGSAVLGDLIKTCGDTFVFEEIVKTVPDTSYKLQIQIIRSLTNFITQDMLRPEIFVQYPFFLDSALVSADDSVQQEALWLIDQIKEISPDTYDQLEKLLSPNANKALRNNTNNPSTAVPKVKLSGSGNILRAINTAGAAEVSKSIFLISSGSYKRPLLNTGVGARKFFCLAKPIQATFAVSGQDDDSQHFNFEPLKLQDILNEPSVAAILPQDIGDALGKPKKAHFDDIVFENPIPKQLQKKEPKPLSRSRRVSDIDFQPKPISSGSHFDEKAFDELPIPKGRRSINILPEIQMQRDSQHPSGRASTKESAKDSAPSMKKPHVVNFGLETDNKPYDPDNRPINTSGSYNFDAGFGDEDIFADNLIPRLPKKPRKPKQIAKFSKSLPASTKEVSKDTNPKPAANNQVSIATQLENLRSDDWSVQNSAIEDLLSRTDGNEATIRHSLRNSVTVLLECAGNNRTTLAKNALSLLDVWIRNKEIGVASVADIMATKLLKLQQSSHHFISEISAKTFQNLLDEIPESRVLSILKREHKSPIAQSRAMLANAISNIVGRIEDHNQFLPPLAYLAKDADPNARKYAKEAISTLSKRCRDFESVVRNNIQSMEDQQLVLRLVC